MGLVNEWKRETENRKRDEAVAKRVWRNRELPGSAYVPMGLLHATAWTVAVIAFAVWRIATVS